MSQPRYQDLEFSDFKTAALHHSATNTQAVFLMELGRLAESNPRIKHLIQGFETVKEWGRDCNPCFELALSTPGKRLVIEINTGSHTIAEATRPSHPETLLSANNKHLDWSVRFIAEQLGVLPPRYNKEEEVTA
jgi:hypothetical protein